MIEDVESPRELAGLAVPLAGGLEETGDPWSPYRLVDPAGVTVKPVAAFFRDLQAAGRSAATVRSYGLDPLRWFRFLWAIQIPWQHATRAEARDFCRWMLVAGKPSRPHWRTGRVPGKASTGQAYAPAVRAHAETVLRGFYGFHLGRRRHQGSVAGPGLPAVLSPECFPQGHSGKGSGRAAASSRAWICAKYHRRNCVT